MKKHNKRCLETTDTPHLLLAHHSIIRSGRATSSRDYRVGGAFVGSAYRRRAVLLVLCVQMK